MALMHCPACGKEISGTAESCPHCGGGINRKAEEAARLEGEKDWRQAQQEERELILRAVIAGQTDAAGKALRDRILSTAALSVSLAMLLLCIILGEIVFAVLCGLMAVCELLLLLSSVRQRKRCEETKAAAKKGWDGYLAFLRAKAEQPKKDGTER